MPRESTWICVVRAFAAGAKAMIAIPVSVRQMFATRVRLDDNRWFIQASSLSDERSRRFILIAFVTNLTHRRRRGNTQSPQFRRATIGERATGTTRRNAMEERALLRRPGCAL